MKKKQHIADIPDLHTVKDIIIYGTEKGKDHKQFVFHNKKNRKSQKLLNLHGKT